MKKQMVKNLAVNLIQPGDNDRKHFDTAALHELAASIQAHGLAQPITVRPMDGGKWFQIVAGERRYRAISTILQWDTVPCLVRELSDEEAAAIMLVENTGRVDLDPIAEANAYQIRIDKFEWTVAKIAEAAGVNAERVRSRLKLLKLADDIQHYVRILQFPIGHAELLVDLDKNRQRIAIKVFNSAKSMPLSRFREVVAELVRQQAEESQIDMFALELQLIQAVAQDEVVALRGKKARTGAPVRQDLPPVKISGKDSTGDIFDRYISELIASGNTEAAATIGNIYNALVAGNWVQVPATSILAKPAESDQTAGDAPVVTL
jgi:ParB family chromosome partitioning protein